MSDTYRSEAEALADALPPNAASPDRCTIHPDRAARWEFEDGYKCDDCRPAGFRLPGGESTSAALRRAEAEIERLRGNEKRWAAEVEYAEAERDKAIAERDSARTEVDVLRRSEALEVVQLESKVRRVEAERDSLESLNELYESELNKALDELATARIEVDLRRTRNHEIANLRGEVERLTASLDARNRALVRARAQIGELIAQATPRHGTTLCPRCGVALAAEVDAEKSTTEGEPQ